MLLARRNPRYDHRLSASIQNQPPLTSNSTKTYALSGYEVAVSPRTNFVNNREGWKPYGKRRTFGNSLGLSSWRQTLRKSEADDPRMLNGIIFRLRSGCQWNRLPKELGDGTIHRTFQRWVERCLAPNMGSLGGTVRRVGRRGLGMAGGRRGHQGTFWGDLIGPNRIAARLAASGACLWKAGPLSVVAGANAQRHVVG